MPNINFQFRTRRLADSLTPQLRRIQTALGIPGRRKILMQAATRFQQMAKSTFGAGNATYRGNKWAKYSPSYTLRVGNSTPTLYRTGKLKASIRVIAPRGNWAGVVANTPYAAAQFLGSKRGLPPRRYFPMEGNGSMWRLTMRADKDLYLEVGRGFRMLSGGSLPLPMGLQQRSAYTYGNPMTSLG